MLGIVMRSVAVYAATASVSLWLVHRFVRPVARASALAIGVAPLLLTGSATFTGGIYAPLDIVYVAHPFKPLRESMRLGRDHTPILGDVVYQEIPWRKAARAAVKRGELPLWNPHVLAGEPLLATQQPAVLHPATWIGFLLPLAQAWTFEMSLRIFLALLCGWIFLKDLGCRDSSALLGAAGWAFSNYLVFFLGYPLSPAAAPFPLLLAGLGRLAKDPGRRSAGLVVVALLLILTSGHPETVLHAVAAAGLFFLFALFGAPDRKTVTRALTLAVVAGVLSLGLSAVLLLPFLEALPHTAEHWFRSSWFAHAERSVPWNGVAARLALEASPLAVSKGLLPQRNEAPFGPSGYCGAVLFPLVICGLWGRRRSRWFFAGLGLLGLSVGTLSPAAAALARLPLFDIAINDRLIFLSAFSVCVLAAFGVDRLHDGEGRAAFFAGTVATLALLGWIFRRYEPGMSSLGISAAEARQRLLLQIVPVLAAAIAVGFLARGRWARAGSAALLLILLAERRLEAGDLYASFPAKAFYPPLSVLEGIPRSEPYRFAALSFTFIPNVAALYGLEDVRGYEAMTFFPIFETYPMWCTHQPVWFNRVDDPTTPFLAFLNVRWILFPSWVAPPQGWTVLAAGEEMRLLENPRALPRAFVPRLLLTEPDPERRLAALRSVRDFGERGVLAEPESHPWTRNGDATVRVVRYAAGRLDLDVDAREASLVGTSITAWPGWRVEVDGRSVPTVSYNHAFLGFRVPAGRHSTSLRYAPTSFRLGLLSSFASLAACVVLLRRPARIGAS